ncbi:MAG: hypothetical protein ACP5EN_16695, partial [Rhodovulum sp.]
MHGPVPAHDIGGQRAVVRAAKAFPRHVRFALLLRFFCVPAKGLFRSRPRLRSVEIPAIMMSSGEIEAIGPQAAGGP